MATIEKKAVVKQRHRRAIDAYTKWASENPKASRKKRMKQFDLLVDSAHLDEIVNK